MMLIVLTTLVLSTSSGAAIGQQQQDIQRAGAMCNLSSERAAGRFKTCSYRCDDNSSFSVTVTKGEICAFVLNR